MGGDGNRNRDGNRQVRHLPPLDAGWRVFTYFQQVLFIINEGLLEEAVNALNDLMLEVQDPMAITSNMMCHVGLTGVADLRCSSYTLQGLMDLM